MECYSILGAVMFPEKDSIWVTVTGCDISYSLKAKSCSQSLRLAPASG